MPISLIEAGMLGLPAVTTDVGSTAEVVIDGKTGFVVETDIQSITEGLRKLIESAKLRTQFGENAREFTTFTFGPKNQLDSHLHAYETALGIKP
jgi:glycosyltransferase involved in cell wall biosynthesis